MLRALRKQPRVVPAQVLSELFGVLVRKAGLPRTVARSRVIDFREGAIVAPTSPSVIEAALDLATDHDMQIFDAIILSASAEAGYRLLLSKDMQDGFVWRGVTVANPFAAEPHPLLADALRAR